MEIHDSSSERPLVSENMKDLAVEFCLIAQQKNPKVQNLYKNEKHKNSSQDRTKAF